MVFRAYIVILLMLTSCASIQRADNSAETSQYFTQADKDQAYIEAQLYIFSGDLKSAVEVLEKGLSRVEKVGDGLDYELMLARVESELGQSEKAYSRYTKMVDLFPQNVSVLKESAQFLYGMKLKEDAYILYSKLTKLQPEESNHWIYKGLIALELSNAKAAWDSFDYLIQKSMDAKHLGHLYMGKLMQMTGSAKTAKKQFLKCIGLIPSSKDCALELALQEYQEGNKKSAKNRVSNFVKEYGAREGRSLVKQMLEWSISEGDLTAAIQNIEFLERLSPSDMQIKKKAALLFAQNKNYTAAAERMRVVVDNKDSTDRDVINYLNMLRVQGMREEALGYLREIEVHKKLGEAIFFERFELAKITMGQKNAERDFSNLCSKLKNNSVPCGYVHAYILSQKGDVKKAKQNLEKIISKNKKAYKVKYFLSQLHFKEGDYSKAMKLVDQVVKSNASYAPALNFKAYVLADQKEKGSLEKAEALSLKALAQQPRNGHYLDTYGYILFKKGSFAEALVVLNEANKRLPNEPEILEHIADVYIAIDQPQRAMGFYRLASQLYKGENLNRIGGKIAQIRFEKKPKRSISSVPESDMPNSNK